jgi:hypothetical protein
MVIGLEAINNMLVECQRSGNEIQLNSGCFVIITEGSDMGKVEFVSLETVELVPFSYPVYPEDLIRSFESMLNTFAHLQSKPWFNANNFFNFIYDFQQNYRIYG